MFTPLPHDDPASSSAPPIRSARRRGLNYLRSYTHTRRASTSQEDSTTYLPRPTNRHSIFRSTSDPAGEQPRVSEAGLALLTGELPQRRASRSELGNKSGTGVGLAPGQTAVNTALGGISRLMARNRTGSAQQHGRRDVDAAPANLAGYPQDQMPTIRLMPHQDPRSTRPSLAFTPTSRTLPHEDCVIRVGRYSERDSNPNPPPNTPSSAPIGFKSKVVSRKHCEFWCSNGQWYIKDVKSSSGTFLNHIRLSQPSIESKPWPVNDGDVVQLGIDFRGGEEMIFRCVKIRVECNRAWQKGLNNFNVTTHKRLRNLGKATPQKENDAASTHSSECSICLMSIAPCQSLFVAPCSHVWHYKCIRPILNDQKTWPQFLCPNCRAVADLEADVDDANDEDWEDEELEDGSKLDESHMTQTNSTHPEHARSRRSGEDGNPAAIPNTIVPVRNGQSSAPPSSNLAPAFSHPPGQSSASNPPINIIHRRNNPWASHSDPPVSEQDNDGRRALPFSSRPRPITPPQPLLRQGISTPNGSPTTRAATDLLVSDGPMTPTNNAGPFVFDGSAGRAAGHRSGDSFSSQT